MVLMVLVDDVLARPIDIKGPNWFVFCAYNYVQNIVFVVVGMISDFFVREVVMNSCG